MRKLILGCGLRPEPGAVNVDKIPLRGVDVVHDLNIIPWPFKDEEFDFIIAEDVLEHLDDVIKVMEEIWRILKPNGRIWIRTNYVKYIDAFTDPTHKHFFTPESFDYFDSSTFLGQNYGFYTNKKFKILEKKERNKGLEFLLEKIK